MAVLSFPASYKTSSAEMASLLTKAKIDKKGWNEVIRSFDAVHVWQEWFAARYGDLIELRHRSNPDDPPDIELIFARGRMGLEHTALQPYPLGYAEAIASEVNPRRGRSLPSLSREWTRQELEKLALGIGDAPWADVGDEHRAAVKSLFSSLQRKAKEPASQVICITDEATFGDANTEWLASELDHLLNTDVFAQFGNRTVILLHRNNDLQFFSALVRRGEPLQAKRNGKPTLPRSPFSF